MKFNNKQILYSILWTIAGIVIAVFGAISSGAGHGPFPQASISVALVGLLISVFSLLVLIILIISGFLGKDIFSNSTSSIGSIPTYNWRCPKCDSVVKANIGVCHSCDFSIKNSPNH